MPLDMSDQLMPNETAMSSVGMLKVKGEFLQNLYLLSLPYDIATYAYLLHPESWDYYYTHKQCTTLQHA